MSTENYYYVTKYALSEGVIMVPRDQVELFAVGTAIKWDTYRFAHGKGRDWHDTRESAETRVEEMKARKRKSLEKSLAKLDKPIKFKVVAE